MKEGEEGGDNEEKTNEEKAEGDDGEKQDEEPEETSQNIGLFYVCTNSDREGNKMRSLKINIVKVLVCFMSWLQKIWVGE